MNYMFLTVFVIGALAVMSPGPDFILISRNSLLHSKQVGVVTALGIALGNLWWVAASILGISYALSQASIAFTTLKLMGAAYLIYIGARALFSKKQQSTSKSAEPLTREKMTLPQAFRMGMITNMFNPKCGLFFMSFFSAMISPSTSLTLRWAYGIEITLIGTIWFSLLANILSIAKVRETFERFGTWIDKVTGAILIAFGLKIALSRS